MCRNGKSGPLGDVPCGFLSPVLDDETAESTKIYRISLAYGIFYTFHETLNYSLDCSFLYTGSFCYFVYYFCFSHNCNTYLGLFFKDCKSSLIFSIIKYKSTI